VTLVDCDELCCICQHARVGLHSFDNPSRHERGEGNREIAKGSGTSWSMRELINVSDFAAKPPSGTPAEGRFQSPVLHFECYFSGTVNTLTS
jgi:hypothetical protein